MANLNKKALSSGEYALLLGLVALPLVAGFETFTGQMGVIFSRLSVKLGSSSERIVSSEASAVVLPEYLQFQPQPINVSYLSNISKEPTGATFPNYLMTYWKERDSSGNLLPREDLLGESFAPEFTYALGVSAEMNCDTAPGAYCWVRLLGSNVTPADYSGSPVALIGNRLALTSFSFTAQQMLVGGTADYLYFKNYANSVFFAPFGLGSVSSTEPLLSFMIDGNGSTTSILLNHAGGYTRYRLADGVFNVAKPDVGLHSATYDQGLYEYVPAEGSIVNLYYAGANDSDQKHVIDVSSVQDWTASCHSDGAKDIVTLEHPENGYSAVFNFHRSPSFAPMVGGICDLSDVNTFR